MIWPQEFVLAQGKCFNNFMIGEKKEEGKKRREEERRGRGRMQREALEKRCVSSSPAVPRILETLREEFPERINTSSSPSD